MDEVKKDYTEMIDQLEATIFSQLQVDCPVVHRFTPGLYIRETLLPAGTILTSKIHKTEHPYVVSKGSVKVWIDGETVLIKAPFCGITQPGTRRVLHALTDTIWTTFHTNPDNETVEEIEERIIEKYENKFIDSQEKEALNEEL